MNNFEKALNDPEVQELYKDKPFHMAVLHAFAKYIDAGYSIFDLGWFNMTKDYKKLKQ